MRRSIRQHANRLSRDGLASPHTEENVLPRGGGAMRLRPGTSLLLILHAKRHAPVALYVI